MKHKAVPNYLQHSKLIKSAILLSIATASVILAIKIYGWITTSSVALFASLLDSMLDISSSLINMVAVRIMLLPPDDNHRFGHNKVQDLAIFSQSIFFFCSAIFTLFSAINKLFNFHEVSHHNVGINVMIVSSICIFTLVCYQNYVYKKTQSYIVAVDKFHNFVDLLTNLSVIISLKVSVDFWFIDLIFAILISVYLLYGCIKLFRKALKNLLDQEFDKTEKQKILNIIRQNTQVLGVHELKTRYAGNKPFIQCHLEVDGNMTLLQAHEIADDISAKIEEEFPGCEVLIHQDPAGYEQCVMYQEKI